jgi:hypothetical protein
MGAEPTACGDVVAAPEPAMSSCGFAGCVSVRADPLACICTRAKGGGQLRTRGQLHACCGVVTRAGDEQLVAFQPPSVDQQAPPGHHVPSPATSRTVASCQCECVTGREKEEDGL